MNKQYFQFGTLRTLDDKVLVVPAEMAFEHGEWQGFLFSDSWATYFEKLVEEKGIWMPRSEVEGSTAYQQIIPWGVFKHDTKYLEIKKGADGPHQRLYMKYCLGTEGHVFEDEFEQFGGLTEWMNQKFHEENEYAGNLNITSIGVVNDNSDDLGKHHIGIVYLLEGDSPVIKTKVHEESVMKALSDFSGEDVQFLDRWSQMVFRQLRDMEKYGDLDSMEG